MKEEIQLKVGRRTTDPDAMTAEERSRWLYQVKKHREHGH